MQPHLLPFNAPSIWPTPPERWSPYTLTTVEACPRRWALANATYEAFDTPGYPERPNLGALRGRIVHEVVETVLREMAAAGCQTIRSACGVAVLRQLGGLRSLVRHHTAVTLDHLKGNPRAEALQDTLHRKLALAMGELVERVNALLGCLTLSDASRSAPSPNAPRTLSADPRMPLHEGEYVEVWLEVPEIQWIGRADLIVVSPNGIEIVDFKMGTSADAHADQLRIYGLLWLLDGKRNPAGRPPTSLRLVYESELIEVPIPENWDALRSTLIERTNQAREKLETSPPPTRPSAENCPFCPVRAPCDAYWLPDVHTQVHAEMESSNFLDVALVIEAQRSPGLWSTRIITGGDFSPGETVLLAPHPSRSLRPGTELRLLGAHRSVNDPSELAPDNAPLLTETTWTECYGKGA